MQQENHCLTHAAYEAIGRVGGALASYADQMYEGLNPAVKEEAQHLLLRMVKLGEGVDDTRRVAGRGDLDQTEWELVRRLTALVNPILPPSSLILYLRSETMAGTRSNIQNPSGKPMRVAHSQYAASIHNALSHQPMRIK